MTSVWWGVLAVLVLWGAVVLWRDRRAEGGRRAGREPWEAAAGGRSDPDDGIDRETLRQAEDEVRDLGTDVKGRPAEDQVGDDWGPGTPKPPYT